MTVAEFIAELELRGYVEFSKGASVLLPTDDPVTAFRQASPTR